MSDGTPSVIGELLPLTIVSDQLARTPDVVAGRQYAVTAGTAHPVP